MMKKLFALLMLSIFIALPACDDENAATQNDPYLASQLVGKWYWEASTDNYLSNEMLTFTNTDFSRSYYYEDKKQQTKKSFSVNGTWNVYKGTLQFIYNVESLQTEGYSDTELRVLREDMKDNNSLVQEQNERGYPYGPTISFDQIGDQQVLIINGMNGYYTRIG